MKKYLLLFAAATCLLLCSCAKDGAPRSLEGTIWDMVGAYDNFQLHAPGVEGPFVEDTTFYIKFEEDWAYWYRRAFPGGRAADCSYEYSDGNGMFIWTVGGPDDQPFKIIGDTLITYEDDYKNDLDILIRKVLYVRRR